MSVFVRTVSAAVALTLVPVVASADGFRTPSGNIWCYLDVFNSLSYDDLPLICLVGEADWPMQGADPDCGLDETRMIVLPPRGPASVETACHGDVFWPVPLGALSYGSEWSLGVFTCSVAADGVRCDNGAGGAFHVRRAALVLK